MKSFRKIVIFVLFAVFFTALFLSLTACQTINRVPDFSVSLNSPSTAIGEVELQLDLFLGLGGLKKQSAAVSYYPVENVICLHYKKDLYNYYQFWNKAGQLSFISAARLYNEDFEAQALEKTRGAAKKYGTVRSYLIWQQLSIFQQARGNMNINLGYSFKDRSPYFTVKQLSAKFVDNKSSDNDRTSDVINLYFTRAQAAALAEIFEKYAGQDMQPSSSSD